MPLTNPVHRVEREHKAEVCEFQEKEQACSFAHAGIIASLFFVFSPTSLVLAYNNGKRNNIY